MELNLDPAFLYLVGTLFQEGQRHKGCSIWYWLSTSLQALNYKKPDYVIILLIQVLAAEWFRMPQMV